MLFRLSNPATGMSTHCGVMEFSAKEGTAYVPYWLMQNLLLEANNVIEVENVSLPKGTFVTLQPHSKAFIELSNPRVVLEKVLRGFSCMTQGDTIRIMVDGISYYLDVVEVKPGNAVSVIETDMNVEFAPPKDMDESSAAPSAAASASPSPNPSPGLPVAPSPVFNDGQVLPGGTPSPAVDANKQDDSSGGYFARLGKGHSLKDKKKKKKKKKRSASSSNDNGHSGVTAAAAAASEAASSSAAAASPPQRKVVKKGKWNYVYEVDPKTGKQRLLRRESAGARKFSAFAGKGHTLT